MAPYRWLVFDLDGTLFDYDAAEVRALTLTFADFDLEFSDRVHRLFREINSGLWAAFERGALTSERLRVQRFEELAQEMDADLPAAEFSEHYLRVLGEQTALIRGAKEVVTALSTSFGLAAATNGIASVQRSRFALSILGDLLGPLVISEEAGAAKPDGRFFVELFNRLGDPAKEAVLMVGDGLSSDIAGGAAFGIDTCWFNPHEQTNLSGVTPTYEIRELSEIMNIVNG